MIRNPFSFLFLACSLVAQAQTRQQMGGVYYAYHYDKDTLTQPVPEGFTPFYISHYGRHGSRWMPSDDRYTWIYRQFEDESNLTPLGLQVKDMLRRVCENAKGNGGKLSKLGALQQQTIAQRMVQSYPQVFADAHKVKARSSVVDRSAKSMQTFTAELFALQPHLCMDMKTDSADMAWIAYDTPEVKALEKRTQVSTQVPPDRFLSQLFRDIHRVDEPLRLMGEIHTVASSIQDVALNFPSYPRDIEDGLYALFTDDEFRAFYDANNERMTICNGTRPTSESIPAHSAISLWQNFEREADAALRVANPSATLRFGHDSSLYRLLSLIFNATYLPQRANDNDEYVVLGGEVDKMDQVVPMGANLQMVFYKNAQDSVLVKFILNEHDIRLSSQGQVVRGTCYYPWKQWKEMMHERIRRLEHIR